MVQQPSSPNDVPTDFDHHVVLFPTRSEFHAPAEVQARSAVPPSLGSKARLRTHVIRQVVLLEVAGSLSEVAERLDRAIQTALADGPRGVVCDLSAVSEGADLAAVEALAMAGRHVRDWPGIPVAVACPDPWVRDVLAAHPLGAHLILTESMFSAVSAVLAAPPLIVEARRLSPHPTAPRASRDFVTRILLDWGLNQLIFSAGLVVSELVKSSTTYSGTDMDVSVTWNLGTLRLTVRDGTPDLPPQPYTRIDRRGPRVTAVAGLSRAFGVLPTADGGKVAWAVLNAARPRAPRSSGHPAPEKQANPSQRGQRPRRRTLPG